MSQPIHTPGPVRVFSPFGRPEVVTDRPTAHETQSVVPHFGQPNADSNARLIAAAYNGFDSAAKKLGLNAVEFAERMRDGEIAEVLEALAGLAGDLRHLIKQMDDRGYYESRLQNVLALLAGVLGDAR
jgi:hypothetical protein